MGDVKQWVNLDPANAAGFVNRYPKLIDDKGRVGPIVPKLEFENGQPTSAKVRVLLGQDNEMYTDAERERNALYDVHPAERIAKNLGPIMVEASAPVRLPAAGLNKYTFEAKSTTDTRHESSRTVEAHRLIEFHYIYTETIVAAGIDFDINAALSLLDQAKSYLGEFGISFEKAPGGGVAPLASSDVPRALSEDVHPETGRPMPKPFNVIRSASDPIVNSALRAKKPNFVDEKVGVSVVWVSACPRRTLWAKENLTGGKPLQLAVKNSFTFSPPANPPPGWSPGGWMVAMKSLIIELPKDRYRHLWHGLDGGSNQRTFLKSLTLRWANGREITREASHATPFDGPVEKYGGYYAMRVDLSDRWEDIEDLLEEPVVMDVEAYIVAGYSGGFSYARGKNVIVVAVTGGFKDLDRNTTILNILMHELGHRFGMAANGDLPGTLLQRTRKWLHLTDSLTPFHDVHSPDRHGNYYDDDSAKDDEKVHRGPHCRSGKGTADACIMYGSNGGIRFCSGCQRHLRKMDLSDIRR